MVIHWMTASIRCQFNSKISIIWDLSAALDCLDSEILCQKLEIYGFDKNSVKWFKSFLTDRSQRVRIGDCLSHLEKLTSGVPQGGIMSPLLNITYVADLHYHWFFIWIESPTNNIFTLSIDFQNFLRIFLIYTISTSKSTNYCFYDRFDGTSIIKLSEGDNSGDDKNFSMIWVRLITSPKVTTYC